MVTAHPPSSRPPGHHGPTDEAIVAAVAAAFGVSKAYLTGPGRIPEMVDARKVAIRLLARRGLGSTAIGRLIGRDHSTVLHHQHVPLTAEQRLVLVDLAEELGLPRRPRPATPGGDSCVAPQR